MKKTILVLAFLVSAITFTSCSKDDPLDPLVGKWSLYEEYSNGQKITLGECQTKGVINFTADGNFKNEYYSSDGNGGCTLRSTYKGTWSNSGDSFYIFKSADNTETTESSEEEKTKISFSGDTFSVGETANRTVYKRK